MNDGFALLEQPRRPCLDLEKLKASFLRLSAATHPDKVHHLDPAARRQAQEQFAALSVAYQRLSNTKERLQLLLELELGCPPAHLHEAPGALMDLAMECGLLGREADKLLDEKARAGSPLLQLQLFPKAQQLVERLRQAQARIELMLTDSNNELVKLDARWTEATPAAPKRALLAELELIFRQVSFLSRWAAQLQERLVRLSF
jgi:curved DNA-binding protein CbpA